MDAAWFRGHARLKSIHRQESRSGFEARDGEGFDHAAPSQPFRYVHSSCFPALLQQLELSPVGIHAVDADADGGAARRVMPSISRSTTGVREIRPGCRWSFHPMSSRSPNRLVDLDPGAHEP